MASSRGSPGSIAFCSAGGPRHLDRPLAADADFSPRACLWHGSASCGRSRPQTPRSWTSTLLLLGAVPGDRSLKRAVDTAAASIALRWWPAGPANISPAAWCCHPCSIARRSLRCPTATLPTCPRAASAASRSARSARGPRGRRRPCRCWRSPERRSNSGAMPEGPFYWLHTGSDYQMSSPCPMEKHHVRFNPR